MDTTASAVSDDMGWQSLPREITQKVVTLLCVQEPMVSYSVLVNMRAVVALSQTCRRWRASATSHRVFWLKMFCALSVENQENFMMKLIVEYVERHHGAIRNRLLLTDGISQMFNVNQLFYRCADYIVEETRRCFAVDQLACTRRGRHSENSKNEKKRQIRGGGGGDDDDDDDDDAQSTYLDARQRRDGAVGAVSAAELGRRVRSNLIRGFASLETTVHTTALQAAARLMNKKFCKDYRLLSEVRSAQKRVDECCGDGPRYCFESMVPRFCAETFWYDAVRMCGSAAFGYAVFWIEHFASQTIGKLGAMGLTTEVEMTTQMPELFSERCHVYDLRRVWNPSVLAQQDEYAERRNCMGPASGVYTCASMNCDLLVSRKEHVSPLANATCGVYCSAWCCFNDALRGATVVCAGIQCTQLIRLRDTIGLTHYNLTNTGASNMFRNYASLSAATNGRLAYISEALHARLAPQHLYINPRERDRPSHMDSSAWWRRRIHSNVEVWHPNSGGVPCLAYYRPAQSDCMPRVYYDFYSRGDSPVAFCSEACRRGYARNPEGMAVAVAAKEEEDAPSARPQVCLNPECTKVFEPGYASASMECLRVVFVSTTGRRVLQGYVCDLICNDSFLAAKSQPAARVAPHKRVRKVAAAAGGGEEEASTKKPRRTPPRFTGK